MRTSKIIKEDLKPLISGIEGLGRTVFLLCTAFFALFMIVTEVCQFISKPSGILMSSTELVALHVYVLLGLFFSAYVSLRNERPFFEWPDVSIHVITWSWGLSVVVLNILPNLVWVSNFILIAPVAVLLVVLGNKYIKHWKENRNEPEV